MKLDEVKTVIEDAMNRFYGKMLKADFNEKKQLTVLVNSLARLSEELKSGGETKFAEKVKAVADEANGQKKDGYSYSKVMEFVNQRMDAIIKLATPPLTSGFQHAKEASKKPTEENVNPSQLQRKEGKRNP